MFKEWGIPELAAAMGRSKRTARSWLDGSRVIPQHSLALLERDVPVASTDSTHFLACIYDERGWDTADISALLKVPIESVKRWERGEELIPDHFMMPIMVAAKLENDANSVLEQLRIYMFPYCIKAVGDGYIILNRHYKTMGTFSKKRQDYENDPSVFRCKITPDIAIKLSYCGSCDAETIYLYNDGCVPGVDRIHTLKYLKRLEVLMRLKVKVALNSDRTSVDHEVIWRLSNLHSIINGKIQNDDENDDPPTEEMVDHANLEWSLIHEILGDEKMAVAKAKVETFLSRVRGDAAGAAS